MSIFSDFSTGDTDTDTDPSWGEGAPATRPKGKQGDQVLNRLSGERAAPSPLTYVAWTKPSSAKAHNSLSSACVGQLSPAYFTKASDQRVTGLPRPRPIPLFGFQ